METRTHTWRGTTDLNISSQRLLKTNRINRFQLVNKKTTPITVNVTVLSDGRELIQLTPVSVVLQAGQFYVDGNIIIEDRSILNIETDGEVDYLFTFDKTYPEGIEDKTFVGIMAGGGGNSTGVYSSTSNGIPPPATAGGEATFSGNGIVYEFLIPHGLSTTPSAWSLIANSDDAEGISSSSSADATNLIVNYDIAPPTGTNNVKIIWTAKK